MRRNLLLPALAMVVMVTSLISSLGGPLIPQMMTHFDIPLHQAQWVLTLPVLSAVSSSPVIGKFSSQGKQRGLVIACMGIVSIGLLLSALPIGFYAMLVGRSLQGIGMALAPVALSLARNALPPERMLSGIANLVAVGLASAGIAFPFSSVFAGVFGVHAVYWFGLSLALITIALVWFGIPRQAQAQLQSIDWLGAALLAAGAGGVVLVLSQLSFWNGLTSLLVVLAAFLLIAVWVRRTLRSAKPLIDLRVLARQGAWLPQVATLLLGAGAYLMIPLVILSGQDKSAGALLPMYVGFLLVPYSIMGIVGTKLGNAMRGQISLFRLFLLGISIYGVAGVILATWHANVFVLAFGMAVAGLGSGGTFSVIPQLLISQLQPDTISEALSLNMMIRFLGFSIGSALAPTLIALTASSPHGEDSYTMPFTISAIIFFSTAAMVLFARKHLTS